MRAGQTTTTIKSRRTAMLLQNKNAVIYGAGGAIGGAVASTFAREGARMFLVGRTRDPLDQVAKDIAAAGGQAEVAVLDVLDEQAVDQHAQATADQAGSIDVSFNLVTRGDVQGTALAEMAVADFVRPIVTGITANFITARAAARQMIAQGSGVILALDSGSAHASPLMGGTGPADAALDTLVRNLALETGPQGVRVLGIWAAGIPDSLSPEKLAAVSGGPRLDDTAFQAVLAQLDAMRMTRRSPGLAEIAATAAFLASDRAAAITGTFVNATGMFPS
jgi:NAD(P)-dependent dehydrogenase (short-subunit alcohol dehydrogenase family)